MLKGSSETPDLENLVGKKNREIDYENNKNCRVIRRGDNKYSY